jgi:hypothetical protein
MMEDPSADVSHDYARASTQRRQLAIWLGFRGSRPAALFRARLPAAPNLQQLLGALWKSVFNPACAVGDA